MRKSGCNKRRLRVRAKPRNGDILLFQRFLKKGASTADCRWQRAGSIPELLSSLSGTCNTECRVEGSQPLCRLRSLGRFVRDTHRQDAVRKELRNMSIAVTQRMRGARS